MSRRRTRTLESLIDQLIAPIFTQENRWTTRTTGPAAAMSSATCADDAEDHAVPTPDPCTSGRAAPASPAKSTEATVPSPRSMPRQRPQHPEPDRHAYRSQTQTVRLCATEGCVYLLRFPATHCPAHGGE